MKKRWQKEAYVNCCFRKERTGMWRMRGIRRGLGKERCTLCYKQEDCDYVLLTCPETMKWREEFLCKKWLDLNQDLVLKKIINFCSVLDLRNIGKYLFRVKGKYENKIKKCSSS
jgi:hypothetical protein